GKNQRSPFGYGVCRPSGERDGQKQSGQIAAHSLSLLNSSMSFFKCMGERSAESSAQEGDQLLQGQFGIGSAGKIRDDTQILRSSAQGLTQRPDGKIQTPEQLPWRQVRQGPAHGGAETLQHVAELGDEYAGQQIAFGVEAPQQTHENHASAGRIAGHAKRRSHEGFYHLLEGRRAISRRLLT